MRYSGTECPFERGVDPGGQAADAVADPGGLAGKVVVESDEPPEFGEGLVADVDPAQRVRHGAGGIRDDECIAGIGFRLAGI